MFLYISRPRENKNRDTGGPMSKVVLLRCDNYQPALVKDTLEKGIELLGGLENFAANKETILLKPNLLAADPPERCTTTHPEVFAAAARLFQQSGARVVYGDSPGRMGLQKTIDKTGLAGKARELDIKPADFSGRRQVVYQQGRQNKQFTLAAGALDCDGMISLAKLKSHGFMIYTGAVKNQFGCVPGLLKGEYHLKLPDANEFARMLVDLTTFLKPRLYIMDGIQAMEGNGPRGGTPRNTGVLLLSTDPVALDATACRLLVINPDNVPTTKWGHEMGLGTCREQDIELLGDDPAGSRCPDFDIRRGPHRPFKSKRFFGFLSNRLVPKPFIDAQKCTKCGTCIQVCPVTPKAVNWRNGDKSVPPVYDYSNCIRCYCCQELCPDSAIFLKDPVMRKILKL